MTANLNQDIDVLQFLFLVECSILLIQVSRFIRGVYSDSLVSARNVNRVMNHVLRVNYLRLNMTLMISFLRLISTRFLSWVEGCEVGVYGWVLYYSPEGA